MSECKPTNTPGYGPEQPSQQPDETLLDEEEKKRYQGIVGCLIYVSQVLRYDIMYAVGQLARPMAKPGKVHMVAAKRTLRYLTGTTDFSITYKRGGFMLAVFSDSNWANNLDDGKSISCYLSMLCDARIGFTSGVQGLTAMSTMQAELVASALAMKEAVFCPNMVTDQGFGKDFATVPLYCDTQRRCTRWETALSARGQSTSRCASSSSESSCRREGSPSTTSRPTSTLPTSAQSI